MTNEKQQKLSDLPENSEGRACMSLEQQYEGILYIIVSYWDFAEPILKRAKRKLSFLLLRNILKGSKKEVDVFTESLVQRWFAKYIYGFSYSPLHIQKALDYAVTDEERANHFYEVLSSEHPLEALCLLIETNFPNMNFAQIEKLTNLRIKKSLFQLHFRKIIVTAILGFSTFLLHTVPDSVIEEVFKISVADFEKAVFCFMVVSVSLVILWGGIFLTLLWRLNRYTYKYWRTVHYVISYLAIRSSSGITKSPSQAISKTNSS